MTKWFDKWFSKKVRESWEIARQEKQTLTVGGPAVSNKRISSDGMTFTVHRANGGHIIETRRYDPMRDIADSSLHVITDDKDLGEEIGKIITYEGLRT